MALETPTSVLVVEDDPGIAELEKIRLEDAGYRVTVAGTADQAMSLLHDHPVDLILLDYRLPGDADGLDLFAKLRANGHGPPVILVTGFSNEAIVVRALRAGVSDFVTKSAEYLDYLPEAVGRVLHQVRTERRLAESEARLGAILGSAKDAIVTTGADRRITFFNAAAERMFRCPVADAIGKPLSRFLPREYEPAPASKDTTGEKLESLTMVSRWGSRGVRTNGDEFPLEASVARAEVSGQKLYTIVIRDVTERKRAEEQLRQQAVLLDQANDAIVVCDLQDRILYWNQGAERLHGWTRAEAIGKFAEELFHRGPSIERAHARQEVVHRGEWRGELPKVTKDGKDIVVETHWTLLRDDDGGPKSILCINSDVTEKKKLESRLSQAQRMESVGVLAGGIAHDFNNLLTVISGYTEILLTGVRPQDKSYDLLREIHRAGERAAGLTRQLLAFSRKQILRPQLLDVNVLVAETMKMLRRMIGEDIDLATALDPTLARVKADPGQIEQVLMNLVVNARDAMPTGGRITVETRNVVLDQSYTEVQPGVQPGPYVLIAVSDTGHGMDDATKAHIFEPFFTTKDVGKGTGLGLATVDGIVKQTGGHVTVYSELGRGTAFKIYLPCVIGTGAIEDTSFVLVQTASGTETVLLVEDEDTVRLLAQNALQSYGYTVLEARNGEEALQICAQFPGVIHLLVTDVVMPKMSGRQLAEMLVQARQGIKVLYLSGYTDDAVIRHGVLNSGAAFLQKPFSPITLGRKVRDVLDDKDQ